MRQWRVLAADAVPIEGQPEEGFSGPGVALKWFQGTDERWRERLHCGELAIVADDGARPMSNTKGKREFLQSGGGR